eukprot:scaffold5490_cov125-Cylindrotheca_fusiformis.AAC.17
MISPARHVSQEDPDDEYDVELTETLGEDFDEATGLMSSRYSLEDEYDLEDQAYSGSFRNLVFVMVIVLIIATLAVVVPENGALWFLKSPARIPVKFTCPSEIVDDANTSKAIAENATEFLKTYQSASSADWGKSYDELKAAMYDFKAEFFPKYLDDDGNSIYDSGCGIGLNLYMTLEILQEKANIDNLIVYGSDHKEDSVVEANTVLGQLAPAHAETGVLCSGKATDLYFVPSESFDLVYTGYISPLNDPLSFGSNRTANSEKYSSLCKADDWKGEKLRNVSQYLQEEWYGHYVKEMARIAKPGSPVIVEQISQPFCDDDFDWGGVSKEWWTASAENNTYRWNIDSQSIQIRDDTLFRERYHVFMLKKGDKPE